MTYDEAIAYLYQLRLFGVKLGLENTQRLAAASGNPEKGLKFIHVAGTNGKGSTCAILESIYRAAGYRVGLFTSPHLVRFNERIQIDRRLICELEVIELVGRIQKRIAHLPADHHPTFFEVVTVMALCHFAAADCDLVIWETGMGGRLDATNIVTPMASVITNVHFDHQKWLGMTHAEIATEKSGIIKPGVPVTTATEEASALAVIQEVAERLKAPLSVVTAAEADSGETADGKVSLLGHHQRVNASLARRTVEVLANAFPVSEERLRAGLQGIHWPGRLQVLRSADQGRILLDGAHNPAGAQALRVALAEHFPGERPTLILGVLRDKDWSYICEILAPWAGRVWLVPVRSERAADPALLEKACRRANPAAPILICGSLGEALSRSQGEPFRVVTGSLYLVGEAMEVLGVSPDGGNEYGLNESAGSQ